MENDNTLDQLLKIEAQAVAMVNDAQEEAERRVKKSEEKNRASYEESCKTETQKLESLLKEEKEKIKKDYKAALESYRAKFSQADVNTESFSALLNDYLAKG